MAKKEIIPGVSEEQVQEWKQKYDEVYLLEVPQDDKYDEFYRCIIRKPNAHILNEYMRKLNNYPIDANIMLIESCWLAGDESIKGDDYVNSAIATVAEEIVGGEARLNKLDAQNSEKLGPAGENFAQWNSKFGQAYLIEIPVDNTYEKFIYCAVRKPVRQQLNKYLNKSERVPIDAARELISVIWLAGDESIKSEIKYLTSATKVLAQIVIGAQSSLKKI
ncbi:MAG: hypothetical protein NW226_17510 [Microscillaceae bacterium]|nr:hypothetical protein [Microscillaceae bacterium]